MQPNIYDVAKRAGVSIATVSRVMNGNGKVKEETKEKIIEIMKALNFQPNMNARGLAHNSTNIIGALMPEFSDYSIPDSFILEFLNGLQQVLSDFGYNLLILNGKNRENDIPDFIKIIQGRRIDGLVSMFKKLDEPSVEYIKGQEIPIVSFGETLTQSDTATETRFNFYNYSRTALKYLKDKGHKDVAVVYYAGNNEAIENRKVIFENVFNELEMNFIQEIDTVNGAIDKFNMFERILSMLESKKYSAVYVDSIFYAQQVINAAANLGLRVPEDLSIICLEYLKNEAQWLQPAVTAIHVDSYRMGSMTANAILSLLQDKDIPEINRISTEVYERNSVRQK